MPLQFYSFQTKWFSIPTILTLVLQLALPATLLNNLNARSAFAQNFTQEGIPSEHLAIVNYFSDLTQAVQNRTAPPESPDHFLLTGQTHRTYRTKKNGSSGTDQMNAEYSLTKGESSPIVNVINPMKELQFLYNSEKQELRIERVRFDSRLKRKKITDVHVFKGVRILSKGADKENTAVFYDREQLLDESHFLESGQKIWSRTVPNFILFSTPEGIRALPWTLMNELIFKAPIPAPVVLPPAPEGYEISEIEFLTPEKTPLKELPPDVKTGDLAIVFVHKDNPTQKIRQWVSRNEVLSNLSVQLLHFMIQVQAANPELGKIDEVARVIDSLKKDIKNFEIKRDQILDPNQSHAQTLIDHALVTASKELDFSQILGTANGINQLQSHYRDPLTEKDWRKNHDFILNARKSAPTDQKSWREILIGRDSVIKETLDQGVEEKQKTIDRFHQRVIQAAKKILTPKRIAILAGFIAFDVAHKVTDAESSVYIVSAIGNALKFTLEVPGISFLANELKPIGPYLTDPTRVWAASRVAIGLAAALALRPLSQYAAAVYARFKGYDWDKVTAFFSLGGRGYARFNIPFIHKVIYGILRQKNLFRAASQGMNPLKTPGALNSPFASNEKILANQKRMDQHKQSTAKRNSRALLIALALVSKESGKDPATLLHFLRAHEANVLEPFLQSLGQLESEMSWSELTLSIYRALSRLSEQGIGDLNEKNVAEYYQVLTKTLQKAERIIAFRKKHGSNPLYRASKWIESKGKAFRRLTSDHIIPFLVYGKHSYEVYLKYRDFEISRESGKIANYQYVVDYDMCVLIYAISDPALFGGAAAGEAKFIARLGADQSEQNLLYGALNGVDVASSEGKFRLIFNPYLPLASEQYAEGRRKKQSTREGILAMLSDQAKNRGSDALRTHRQYLNNTITGFQVRLLAGVIPKAIGLSIIGISAAKDSFSGAIAGGFVLALSSIPRQTTILLNKFGVNPYGTQLRPGYAMVWPYVVSLMRSVRSPLKQNMDELRNAHILLSSDRPEMYQKGVTLMQSLYKRGSKKLPSEFNIPGDQYTVQLSHQFLDYSIQPSHIPLPTIASHRISVGLNAAGTLFSTVIFIGVSRNFYDPNASVLDQFWEASKTFFIAYAGITVLHDYVAPMISRKRLKGAAIAGGTAAACWFVFKSAGL